MSIDQFPGAEAGVSGADRNGGDQHEQGEFEHCFVNGLRLQSIFANHEADGKTQLCGVYFLLLLNRAELTLRIEDSAFQ